MATSAPQPPGTSSAGNPMAQRPDGSAVDPAAFIQALRSNAQMMAQLPEPLREILQARRWRSGSPPLCTRSLTGTTTACRFLLPFRTQQTGPAQTQQSSICMCSVVFGKV